MKRTIEGDLVTRIRKDDMQREDAWIESDDEFFDLYDLAIELGEHSVDGGLGYRYHGKVRITVETVED